MVFYTVHLIKKNPSVQSQPTLKKIYIHFDVVVSAYFMRTEELRFVLGDVGGFVV